jgi:N-methylhydantoinase B
MFGGYPGAPSILVHRTGTSVRKALAENCAVIDLEALGGEPRILPYCSVELGKNDVFYMRFGGGGGYGDPLQRDPTQVVQDVNNGLMSVAAAEALYGVVLDAAGSLDPAATERRRKTLEQERLSCGEIKSVPGTRPRRSTDLAMGHSTDAHPLEEYLEIAFDAGGAWIRCKQCSHVLCSADEEWTDAVATRKLLPTAAGRLMKELNGVFLLKQFYCPSCAVLLRNEIVLETSAAHA